MGSVIGSILPNSPPLPNPAAFKVASLAEAGVLHPISAHVGIQLQLDAIDGEEIALADGTE